MLKKNHLKSEIKVRIDLKYKNMSFLILLEFLRYKDKF